MKAVLMFALIASASVGQAATFYFVNGKQVENAGAAKRAAVKDPKATIVKIQATEVKMNEETMNLKKSKDLTIAETKTVIR